MEEGGEEEQLEEEGLLLGQVVRLIIRNVNECDIDVENENVFWAQSCPFQFAIKGHVAGVS